MKLERYSVVLFKKKISYQVYMDLTERFIFKKTFLMEKLTKYHLLSINLRRLKPYLNDEAVDCSSILVTTE